MLFLRGESERLINAELSQWLVILVLLGLLKEKGASFLIELRDSFWGQVNALSFEERTKERIDQVLVRFTKKLVHNLGKASGGICDLLHHGDNLTDNDSAIQLVVHAS